MQNQLKKLLRQMLNQMQEATAEEGAPADSSVVEEEAVEGGEDADAAEMPAEEASKDMEAN